MAMDLNFVSLSDAARELLGTVSVKAIRRSDRFPRHHEAVVWIGGKTGVVTMRMNVARLSVGTPDGVPRGPAGWGCQVMQNACRELGDDTYWLMRTIEDQSDRELVRFEQAEARRASDFRFSEDQLERARARRSKRR